MSQNNHIYGRCFAEIYNDHWSFWGLRVWPLLRRTVRQNCPAASTWLDLCCGTGSLLRLVTRAGYRATGLDLSPHQLRRARANAPKARLVRGDVRNFSLPGRFDVVTCLLDSLNYLTRRAELQAALRCVKRHLADGGVFAFDVHTHLGLARNWNARTSVLREPGRTVVITTSFDRHEGLGRCMVSGMATVGRRCRAFHEEHVERAYPLATVESLLRREGFKFIRLDGDRLAKIKRRPSRVLYICRCG